MSQAAFYESDMINACTLKGQALNFLVKRSKLCERLRKKKDFFLINRMSSLGTWKEA